MPARGALPRLHRVIAKLPVQRVEVSFAGPPPVRRIERASGVSDVDTDGAVVRCLVTGSFQPFLEALRGYEVLILKSTPAIDAGGSAGVAPTS